MTALMYHDVVADGCEDGSGFPGRDAALYKVAPARFEQHLAAIADARLTPSRYRTGPADPPLPAPVLTFDDGGVSAMAAADVLERHGLIGHFFITTNYIGRPGFLGAPQIRELRTRGHAIGSHSCSHPLRMGHCPWPQLVDEWTRSRAALMAILDEPVEIASVPGGDFSPAVAEAAARAGITRLFTSEPTRAVRRVFGLTLVGRYAIQRWTSAASAAALAAGRWSPCARQALLWSAKKLSKRLGGTRYLQMRKLLLGHGDDVRWGDVSNS